MNKLIKVKNGVNDIIRVIKSTENWFDLVLYKLRITKNEPVIRFKDGTKLVYVPKCFSVEHSLEKPYRHVKVEDKDVLDIGAFNGDSAIYFSKLGARNVYAFEPFPRTYNVAVKNLNLNGTCNVNLYNEVLGIDGDSIKISKDFEATNGSKVKNFETGIEVKVRKLDEIVESFNINEGVLKMDCEGCEYKTLRDAKDETLKKFDQIMLEYHGGHKEISDRLNSLGFKIIYMDNSGKVILNPLEKRGLLYAQKQVQIDPDKIKMS